MKKRIIIVSNRLPINITEHEGKLQAERSNGGVATALSSLLDKYDAQWIGWPGTAETISRWQLAVLHGNKQLIPVNIPVSLLHRYYNNFANGVLWPMLHGFGPVIKPTADDWEAYRAVNLKFARQIKRTCKSNDTIWLHDYHLLLVPEMLREMGVINRIGFFLHSPYAAAACLEAIPQFRELLHSLAQVDVLGLQTDIDVANFAESLSTAGIAMRPGSILQAFPIGVDYRMYQGAANRRDVRKELVSAVDIAHDKQVIVSISRLDYTKGIPQQLQAYERFLSKQSNPEQFLYKLIVAPSREAASGYQELKVEIESLVDRINKRFGAYGHQAVDYTYRNCGFAEVSAWYLLADVLLVTPRADGMNLVVKEYIATRSDNNSMLVLSNAIGAARQLQSAIQVDPLKVPAIAQALEQALTMDPVERAQRWQAMRSNVREYDVFWWVNTFMEALDSRPQTVLHSEALHQPRLGITSKLHPARLLQYAHFNR